MAYVILMLILLPFGANSLNISGMLGKDTSFYYHRFPSQLATLEYSVTYNKHRLIITVAEMDVQSSWIFTQLNMTKT